MEVIKTSPKRNKDLQKVFSPPPSRMTRDKKFRKQKNDFPLTMKSKPSQILSNFLLLFHTLFEIDFFNQKGNQDDGKDKDHSVFL